ncbi:MAG: hypothetical protein KBE23_02560 [Chloroflexi bacterium]|nr:hypothetical protein [Chloroflexota bacterium]MBP7041595.1 hypothetical protein [Chloroflexota bacterium]
MNKNLSSSLDVYDSKKKQRVARIALNGYDIKAGSLLPASGAMRSFVILDGDLWEPWNAVATLRLRHETGTEVAIRVAALPVEDDGYGLIEFL